MNSKRRIHSSRQIRTGQKLIFETLEQRTLLAADPILSGQPLIISELVADSTSTLLTRTRASAQVPFEGEVESPDWIELLSITDQRLDLGGMHLTDEATDLTKWQFPVGTFLDAGAFLVVLASGHDIVDPALDELGLLHTNFRLNSAGEYLALTDNDGTVLHEFSPTFPSQRTDVSYSVPMEVRTLIGSNAPIEYLVPTDNSLEAQWRLPGFSDSNLISQGATSPIGFDRGGGPAEQGETIGADLTDRPSVDFARGSLAVLESMPFTSAGRVAEWSFYSTKTNSITPLVLRASGDEFEITGVGRTRQSDGSGEQSFSFDPQSGSDTVEPTGYFFGFKDGDNVTDESGVIGWSRSDTDSIRRYNGPLSGRIVAGQQLSGGRAFDRTFSARATTQARLVGPFNTDVDSAMTDAASLYVRYPFEMDQLDTLRTLSLRVRYDDGFVAYLNGTEVARRNVPPTVGFDSLATSNHSIRNANQFEQINISSFRSSLAQGQNVLAFHGVNDDRAGSDFLIDSQLLGVDMQSVENFGFASDPTPGGTSEGIFREFVNPTSFSHPRGLYDQPFTLQLNTPGIPDAVIYYTTDGTDPAPDNPNATPYQQPIEITATTVLRAAGHLDGLLPSLPQTQTYVLPANVATQSTLQPRVMEDPIWGPQFMDALKALPTMSLVTAEAITVEGEIPTSVELIFPDASDGFQVDAGVEVFGGTAVSFPKRSMRLSFKNIYGPSTFRFDVFNDPDGVMDFDQLLLRPGSHDTPFWNGGNGVSNYIRNRWANDRQLDMGQPAPRGRFVHLYLNGVYWGQYQLLERPNAAFMASNFGGDKNDYDALNAGTPVDGDDAAWKALIDALDDGYDAVRNYLDVDNYADYLLLQFYGGNDWDWRPESNWMAARRREDGAGFQFFAWDSDLILRNGPDANNVFYGGPGFLWTLNGGVRQYPEFVRLLAERAQTYFYDGGIFTDESLRSQIDEFIDQLGVSIIAETARWGSGLYTPDTWMGAMQWVKDTYAPEDGPSRAETVIEQLRLAGLFPLSDRPEFSIDGQPVQSDSLTAGTRLTMSAPEGVIYYTLDGSDPWANVPSVEYTTLIAESAPARVLVPPDGSLRSDWRGREFDDSAWMSGQTGVGYDVDNELNSLVGLNVQEQMKDINASAYIRVPFQISDPSQFETLDLSMRYDDGFVAYLNGVEVARRNARGTPTWNSRASQAHANVEAIEFEQYNLSRVLHLLEPGENVLAIHGLNADPANVDFLLTPMLRAGKVADAGVAPSATLYSGPVTVPLDATVSARTLWGDQWSTLRTASSSTQPLPLRISELMYHPADPTSAELTAGYTDADDFEFIEIVNISDSSIDLAGVEFVQTSFGGRTEGVAFDFDQGTVKQLGPGQRVVVVENGSAFQARYGTGLSVAGEWRGGLSNGSETVTLQVNDVVLQQFAYDDSWYPETDGQGFSLEVTDVINTPIDQYENPQRWRASEVIGGTPGRAVGPVVIAGDANGDGQFNQTDLDHVLATEKYLTGEPATFEQGDWNGDGVFDSYDVVDALIRGEFSTG